jgi:hypothetical protein
MTAVLGIGIGSRGGIAIMTVEGRLIDALDIPCLNDGPAGRRAVNGPLLARLDTQSVLIEEQAAEQAEPGNA